jgi:dienelactone hydrolase
MPVAGKFFEIKNRDGYVKCEFFRAYTDKAIIYMHGVGGGTHGPSDIYHLLAEDLQESGISSLLIDCRYDSNMDACISDVRACIDYLEKNYHIDKIGLIGWSFGGAVVIAAAAADRRVKTVVTVASQSSGTKDVSRIAPRPILLIHGTGDNTLNYDSSVDIAERAREPKKLVLFPGADHGISQNREEMYELVREWFLEHLQG